LPTDKPLDTQELPPLDGIGSFLRYGAIFMLLAYLYGVFSGYFFAHGPYHNDNPNVWINSLILPMGIFAMRDVWRRYRSLPSLPKEAL